MKNPLKITLITAAMAVASVSQATTVRNAACWGDNNRQDISCQALTDEFLLSLRDATKTEVVKAMGVSPRGATRRPASSRAARDGICHRPIHCPERATMVAKHNQAVEAGKDLDASAS